MMNRKEFQDYIKDNIKDYLPDSYENAKITFNEVVKNNDNHLTGISITRPGERIVPNIYIENFWNEYQYGKHIDDIVGDIADMRIEYGDHNIDMDLATSLYDYEAMKDNLQIRLCDTNENQERLKNMVHTEHGDFSATYHVNLQENEAGTTSSAVTPQLMEVWGISVEQLHADAIASDAKRGAILSDMQDIVNSMMFDMQPNNLLSTPNDHAMEGAMFVLTNEGKVNGAGMILQDEVMEKISKLVEGNFYVLPSSCHEVLIVPENAGVDLKDLSAMVYEVNRSEVSKEDFLSDHVQFYDKDTKVLENAQKREARLEAAKEEKTAGKKSIRDRIGEKKEQSAARKAEKAATKSVHKEKGAEL